jgi:hypothetical protein
MPERDNDPGFDREEYETQDPLGEDGFERAGFADAPGGGPDFDAAGLESDDRPPGGHGQKVGGVPEDRQREPNTPSEQRPDSQGYVVKERGGASKGDPGVGGTRPD